MQKRKQFTNDDRQAAKDIRIWFGWLLVIINAIILYAILKKGL